TVEAIVECYIGIHSDGSLEVLKELVKTRTPVFSRQKRRRELVHLEHREWRFPLWMWDLCDDTTESCRLAREMFAMAMLTHHATLDYIAVRPQQGGWVAACGIDLPQAKRFFADRQIELAADGKRKRIFHAVASHDRRLEHGTTRVRAHYRG